MVKRNPLLGAPTLSWVSLFLALGLLGGSCKSTQPINPSTGVPIGAVKGFGFSPQGFPGDFGKTPEFFTELKTIPNGGVMWSGPWRDDEVDGSDAGMIPTAAVATMQSAALAGVTPIIVFGWRSETTLYLKVPSNSVNNWTNADAESLFLSMLVQFAVVYRPPFLFLGNETDFYYEQDVTDYANWVRVYQAAFDTLKKVSPMTRVGTIFSYEHMAGAGGLVGWIMPRWGALTGHDLKTIDVVGITSYPWFHFRMATDVPSNYFNALKVRIPITPIAITETGWPAESLGGLTPLWETSPAAQVVYLDELEDALKGMNVAILNWLFLHQMVDPGGSTDEWKLFGSVSLRDSLGQKRPVYDSWVGYLP